MWSSLKQKFIAAFTANASPNQIAWATALGVFIGLNPFLVGLQSIAAIGTAFIFRVNKPGILLGSLLPFPFWIPFIFLASKIGCLLMGAETLVTMENIKSAIENANFGLYGKYLSDMGVKGIVYPFYNLWLNTKSFLVYLCIGYLVLGVPISAFCFLIVRITVKTYFSKKNSI